MTPELRAAIAAGEIARPKVLTPEWIEQAHKQACRLRDPWWVGEQKAPVGFVAAAYMRHGGTETYHRMLIPKLQGVLGMAVTWKIEGDVTLLKVPVLHGMRAAQKLAQRVETLVVWGVAELDELFIHGRPRRVIMADHGDLSCQWFRDAAARNMHLVDEIACVHPAVAKSTPKGVYMPNGIDTSRCATARAVEPKLCVWIHRASSEKRPWLALEIAKRMPDWTFVFAGQGHEQHVLDNHGLPNVIRVERVDNPKGWLARAAVFLSTSSMEGFGYSVGEAVLSCVPVVAAPVGLAKDAAWITVHNEIIDDWCEAIRLAAGADVNVLEKLRKEVAVTYSADAFVRRWADYLGVAACD